MGPVGRFLREYGPWVLATTFVVASLLLAFAWVSWEPWAPHGGTSAYPRALR